MIRLFRKIYCKRNHIPYKIHNKWYNLMAMDKYGLNCMINIFDKNNNYIDAKENKIVEVLFRSKEGQTTCQYRINKISLQYGGDFLYESDNINVDLVFIKFVEKLDFEGFKKRIIDTKCKSCLYSGIDCKYDQEHENTCSKIKRILKDIESEVNDD